VLKVLKIFNFQSHVETSLKFTTGLNAIVGITGSGKSAIMRAIRWVLENRPIKEDIYQSWHGGTPSVAMTFEDGTTVERKRENKKNTYTVNGVVNEAFRLDVPNTVRAALNIEPVNYQWQKEQFYMVGDSPGEVAKKLNMAVALTDIDTSVSNINSMLRDNTRDNNRLRLELSNVTAEYESYSWLSDAESMLLEIEAQEEKHAQMLRSKEKLTAWLAKYGVIRIVDMVPLEEEYAQLESLALAISDLSSQTKQLTALLTTYDDSRTADCTNLKTEHATLLVLEKEFNQQQQDVDTLGTLLDENDNIQEVIHDAAKEVEEKQVQLKKIMPEECPLCHSKLKK